MNDEISWGLSAQPGSLLQEYALQGAHIHVGTGIWDERFLAWDSGTSAYVARLLLRN